MCAWRAMVAPCRGCRRSYMITMHGRDTMGVVGAPEGPTGALHVRMARDGVWRLVAAAAAPTPSRCTAMTRWRLASCRGCRRSCMITMHGNDAMAVVGGPEGPTDRHRAIVRSRRGAKPRAARVGMNPDPREPSIGHVGTSPDMHAQPLFCRPRATPCTLVASARNSASSSLPPARQRSSRSTWIRLIGSM